MNENMRKQDICNKLCEALQLTDSQSGLKMLDYDRKSQTITAIYDNGYSYKINVDIDSGLAMIFDIIHSMI